MSVAPDNSQPVSSDKNTQSNASEGRKRRQRFRKAKKPGTATAVANSNDTTTKPSDENANATQEQGAQTANSKPKKPRNAKKRPQKVTQRKSEIEDLKSKYQTFQIEFDLFQVLLMPSDPDFPFKLPVLDMDVHVPRHYPTNGIAYIEVNNEDIPKGIAANIENAFSKYPGTLREKLDKLDSTLDKIMAMPPAPTIKIVKLKPKKPADTPKASEKQLSEGEQPKDEQPKDEQPKDEKPKDEKPKEKPEDEKPEVSAEPDVGGLDLNEIPSESESSGDDYDPDVANSSDSESEEDVDSGLSKRDMTKPKREGTELVFSNIKMTNIAMCEIVSLNVLMQCGRCKTMHTFSNLQSADYGKDTKPRAELCGKCDLPLMMAFRKEYLHPMSHTAGYLDIEGGKAADLLPSSYIAMCDKCQEWSPVFKSVTLGSNRMIPCRNCHTKLWLTLDLFDFVLISSSTLSASAKSLERSKLPPSAPKQQLKLTGGQPLERMGVCDHYRKSTRWFRFTCCQRVFPCDKCHDLEMNHPSEQTSRMICGYCSREQKFTTKCVYCGHDYTQRVTSFWEGGTGVRDRKLMSRKDKRKYKRDPGEKQKNNGPHFQGKSKPAPI